MKPNEPADKRSADDIQLRPLAGETAPEDARRKALHFGVVEKLRLDAVRRASDAKASRSPAKGK
jgi:hypothetical protein